VVVDTDVQHAPFRRVPGHLGRHDHQRGALAPADVPAVRLGSFEREEQPLPERLIGGALVGRRHRLPCRIGPQQVPLHAEAVTDEVPERRNAAGSRMSGSTSPCVHDGDLPLLALRVGRHQHGHHFLRVMA
jgi:hypothetical protein